MDDKGMILAFTSSKGGVGKTHLAIGLSSAIARRDARVLLIDADLGNGMISDRIGFYPTYNLAHFFSKERPLEDLVEETSCGFFLIGGERGSFALANLNYLQKMRFLRRFQEVSRGFDFVVLDLASGITRQVVDFALLAEKTLIVTSPQDLISGYGSVRACFARFIQLEHRLCQRIDGYKARRFFTPLILMNNATDLHEGKAAFEALESASENRLHDPKSPFRIKMEYLGSVFHDPGLFRKSEIKRCPVSVTSPFSKVAFCVDSIAAAISRPVPSSRFDAEKRFRYTLQILLEHQERLRKGFTQKVKRIYPPRLPLGCKGHSISP
ncbi:MAG: AAA family ATPase [Proteobacteria bacterium]|nr:AAA family ATPase [Pseudomonadota bacterium]